MTNTYKIQLFLKFGQKDNLIDLYQNGTVYMNPIQHFREIEDIELRGDKYEGVSRIINYPPGQFEIPKLSFKGNYECIHLRESYEKVLGNIYSLYCISSHGWKNPNDFEMDKRLKRFGSHCLLIKDNKEFLSRIEKKLKELKMKFRHNFVEYYEKKTINRQITVFEKPSEFEYQKEFRFYIENDLMEPIVFSVGSLVDISELYLSEEIVNELKLKTA